MDLVIGWLCYLGAFLAGSLVAWLAVALSVRYVGEQEACDAMPGSRALSADDRVAGA